MSSGMTSTGIDADSAKAITSVWRPGGHDKHSIPAALNRPSPQAMQLTWYCVGLKPGEQGRHGEPSVLYAPAPQWTHALCRTLGWDPGMQVLHVTPVSLQPQQARSERTRMAIHAVGTQRMAEKRVPFGQLTNIEPGVNSSYSRCGRS